MTETIQAKRSYRIETITPNFLKQTPRSLIHDDLGRALEDWAFAGPVNYLLDTRRICMKRLDDTVEEVAERLRVSEFQRATENPNSQSCLDYRLLERERRAIRIGINSRYGRTGWAISKTMKYFANIGLEIKYRKMKDIAREAARMGFSPSPHNLLRLGLINNASSVSKLEHNCGIAHKIDPYDRMKKGVRSGRFIVELIYEAMGEGYEPTFKEFLELRKMKYGSNETNGYERRGTTRPPQYSRRVPRNINPFKGKKSLKLFDTPLPNPNPNTNLSRLGYRF